MLLVAFCGGVAMTLGAMAFFGAGIQRGEYRRSKEIVYLLTLAGKKDAVEVLVSAGLD